MLWQQVLLPWKVYTEMIHCPEMDQGEELLVCLLWFQTPTQTRPTRGACGAQTDLSFHHLYKMLNWQQLAQSNTHFLHGRWRHIHIGVGGEETGFYTGTQFRLKEAKRRRTNKNGAKVKMYWWSKTGLCLTIKKKAGIKLQHQTEMPISAQPCEETGLNIKDN